MKLLSRTTEDWIEIFSNLPSPNSVEEDIASRVISDLLGYDARSKHRTRDVKSLANALIVYARMLQEHDLKV